MGEFYFPKDNLQIERLLMCWGPKDQIAMSGQRFRARCRDENIDQTKSPYLYSINFHTINSQNGNLLKIFFFEYGGIWFGIYPGLFVERGIFVLRLEFPVLAVRTHCSQEKSVPPQNPKESRVEHETI